MLLICLYFLLQVAMLLLCLYFLLQVAMQLICFYFLLYRLPCSWSAMLMICHSSWVSYHAPYSDLPCSLSVILSRYSMFLLWHPFHVCHIPDMPSFSGLSCFWYTIHSCLDRQAPDLSSFPGICPWYAILFRYAMFLIRHPFQTRSPSSWSALVYWYMFLICQLFQVCRVPDLP